MESHRELEQMPQGINQQSHQEWPLQPTKSVMISRGGSSSKGWEVRQHALGPKTRRLLFTNLFPSEFMSWIQQDWRYEKPSVGNGACPVWSSLSRKFWSGYMFFLTQQSENALCCKIYHFFLSSHCAPHPWCSARAFSDFSFFLYTKSTKNHCIP